jgi:S-DNA-T family DNA segregation ATPase FtsK/SpoIIIE
MRPNHRQDSPPASRSVGRRPANESSLRSAGLSGARALTRLILLLLENLGTIDRDRVRVALERQNQQNRRDRDPNRLHVGYEGSWETLPEAYPPAGFLDSQWDDDELEPLRLRDAVTGPATSDAPGLDRAPPAPPPSAAEKLAMPVDYGSAFAGLTQPLWRTPFVALPGVRYVRTPDSLLRRAKTAQNAGEPDAPIPPLAVGELAGFQPQPAAGAEEDAGLEAAIEPGPAAPLAGPRRLNLKSGYGIEAPQPANDEDAPSAPADEAERVPQPVEAQAPDGSPNAQAFAVVVRPKATRASLPVQELAVEGVAMEEPAAQRPRAKAPRRTAADSGWDYPPVPLLAEPRKPQGLALTSDALEQNARLLESVLEDFGIRGEIIHVRAGPVVTLYELEPAPGMKSSRVIGLADDIARSMSALSARVAVVPGRNAIGIELPNERRETVYFRELVDSEAFRSTQHKLALCLGKTIGGENVIAELAKMPHLLVAGTTGSGKSVAINTMILSLLYRLRPDECRLIMVDPKMLELSVYDGIPHLLTPVVTDPKKAVVALKWAVREMEDRYKKMSKVGVRNIDGFNARVTQAAEANETIMIGVTTGYDKETGKPILGEEALDLTPLPYIVVIVDEMADLMMVAGKEIEGAIQRLAQMARAAGIHLIMATQRPSVDVITGTIKANFPTRISFQVTSKIDSRTILGEQGAEQLLGQGDMLHMQGGGRIYRVHGPFVSDDEVEKVVAHLKAQGQPDYLESVTDDVETAAAEAPEPDADGAVFDKSAMASEDGNELYDQAVRIVLRDKKCSVSYVQRRMQIGYNKAASLIERMEKEGVLGPANHSGKREILAHSRARVIHGADPGDLDEEV